jgi:hypothetical protein
MGWGFGIKPNRYPLTPTLTLRRKRERERSESR